MIVRPLAAEDAAAALPLFRQLGYAVTEVELVERLRAIVGSEDHFAAVAESGDRLVGLVHGYLRRALEKPPALHIQALVVERARRGTGIGAALMHAAEEWALAAGFQYVVLYTHIDRAEARSFYGGLGYRPVATSHLLAKELGRPAR